MAKLTIRTIEIDLDSATLPELARSIIGTVMNGHANGQVIAAVAEPLKLPEPAAVAAAEDKPPRKKYTRRAKAVVDHGSNGEAPKRKLGRPPKSDPRYQVSPTSTNSHQPAARPVPTGTRLGDKIETLMMQAGRGVNTVFLMQRLPGAELKNIRRALSMGINSKRFTFDDSDDTYSLAEVC